MPGQRGGYRPGAGGKTAAEKAMKRAAEAARLSPIDELGAKYEEEVWQRICEKAAEGNRDAQKLFAEHQWGRPGQKQQGANDPEINLFCSFRGEPWLCRDCGRKTNPEGKPLGEFANPPPTQVQPGGATRGLRGAFGPAQRSQEGEADDAGTE